MKAPLFPNAADRSSCCTSFHFQSDPLFLTMDLSVRLSSYYLLLSLSSKSCLSKPPQENLSVPTSAFFLGISLSSGYFLEVVQNNNLTKCICFSGQALTQQCQCTVHMSSSCALYQTWTKYGQPVELTHGSFWPGRWNPQGKIKQSSENQ